MADEDVKPTVAKEEKLTLRVRSQVINSTAAS